MTQSWKCVTCDKDFKVGEWLCADGTTNHVVVQKTYRTLDAPLDPGRPAAGTIGPVVRGRTVICNIPPPKKVMEGNDTKYVGEGHVEFVNGIFSTSDPEIQYWLDKKSSCNATEEQWKKTWLTSEELMAEREIELRAREQRLENDRNELLAQVKQQKAKPVAA